MVEPGVWEQLGPHRREVLGSHAAHDGRRDGMVRHSGAAVAWRGECDLGPCIKNKVRTGAPDTSSREWGRSPPPPSEEGSFCCRQVPNLHARHHWPTCQLYRLVVSRTPAHRKSDIVCLLAGDGSRPSGCLLAPILLFCGSTTRWSDVCEQIPPDI